MALYALADIVPQIDPDAFVHPDCTIIGNVVIAAGVTIWPQAVLRGDQSRIVIGATDRPTPGRGSSGSRDLEAALAEVERRAAAGTPRGEAARQVAAETGLPRRRLYQVPEGR